MDFVDLLLTSIGIFNFIRAYKYYVLEELNKYKKPLSIIDYIGNLTDIYYSSYLFFLYPVRFWEYGELRRKAFYINIMTYVLYLIILITVIIICIT